MAWEHSAHMGGTPVFRVSRSTARVSRARAFFQAQESRGLSVVLFVILPR